MPTPMPMPMPNTGPTTRPTARPTATTLRRSCMGGVVALVMIASSLPAVQALPSIQLASAGTTSSTASTTTTVPSPYSSENQQQEFYYSQNTTLEELSSPPSLEAPPRPQAQLQSQLQPQPQSLLVLPRATKPPSTPVALRVNGAAAQVKQATIMSLMSISGMVAAVCYGRFKSFPNMMTGNTVRFLDALVAGRWQDVGLTGCIVVSYVGGSALYRLLEQGAAKKQQQQQQQQPSNSERGDHTQAATKTATLTAASTLESVSLWSLLAFAGSDLVRRLTFAQTNPLWRFPAMALSFGLINAASSEMFGTVTNAVTGHWSKIGLGLMASSDMPNPAAARTSLLGMTVWSLSLMLTTLTMRFMDNHSSMSSSSSSFSMPLPPMGLSFGLLYGTVLTGYAQYCRRTLRFPSPSASA